ncbi:MAG: L-rhamnose mutarotase [Herbinix sp.]|jgi:L-rhamnose mutarotase|nr:L-rhamnose mutarotase [Herbinix sp.]
MRRYGQIIQLKPEYEGIYKELHRNPWPEVNEVIKECNISNYSIFLKDNLLFAYFEYEGMDFEGDMRRMGESEITKLWWEKTDPCQIPISSAGENEWWVNMEVVYHLD